MRRVRGTPVLHEEADRRRSPTDNKHFLVAEVFRLYVLARVQLAASEGVSARIPGNEGRTPRAGGIDHYIRGDLVTFTSTVFVLDDNVKFAIRHQFHVGGAHDIEFVVLLVPTVVVSGKKTRQAQPGRRQSRRPTDATMLSSHAYVTRPLCGRHDCLRERLLSTGFAVGARSSVHAKLGS